MRTVRLIAGLITTLWVSCSWALADNISLFPLDNYPQTISHWINPADADYNQPLLTGEQQQQHMQDFYQHYFGAISPWSADHVQEILHTSAGDELGTTEQAILKSFDNAQSTSAEIGYGVNFHAYTPEWIASLTQNINPGHLNQISYAEKNRAIAIDNLHARALPTDDPFFYSYKIAGEGYPFDNLQMSAVWAGTPLYILGETEDHAWSLVLTPEYIAWVKTNGIARVDNAFILQWTGTAKKQLVAISRTATSVNDNEGHYLFTAYIGSVFPAQQNKILVPVMTKARTAEITEVTVPTESVVSMPLTATPHQFANILQTLIGRPYGWGNLYFYNDCSAETKSVLTPFGIWLPRNSFQQTSAGKMTDLSARNTQQRLEYLTANGKKFLTLVYVGGHVVLYIGHFPNPNHFNHTEMNLSYQNAWGLAPSPSTRRAIIGKAVFLPLLTEYPEDLNLNSQAAKKYFQVIRLDEASDDPAKLNHMNLKALMMPVD
jgi:cell wall-associated NlpC family hydrolase